MLATAPHAPANLRRPLPTTVGERTGPANAEGPRDQAQLGQRSGGDPVSPQRRWAERLDLVSLAVAPAFTLGRRAAELVGVRTGLINPPDDSRLGAYEATAGHERGTVGRGANNSIGAIYMLMGTYGQDRIGNVFHSEQAQQTLPHSVRSSANGELARTEFGYWQNQRDTQGTEGGYMGSAFSPAIREGIQQVMSIF